jgi:hypothetical protein
MIIFLNVIKEHSTQQLLQCRPNFFVCHREHSNEQMLMIIQNKKLLQMMEFSNILIIEVKILGIAWLYNGVTIIIETNNSRFKVRRNEKYVVS